jgi:hypothetical protein
MDTTYSENEIKLFETLDVLNEIHDEIHGVDGFDDFTREELIQYAQARAQIMLVAEIHKMRDELERIRTAIYNTASSE